MITYLMIEPPADRSKLEGIYLHYKGLLYHTGFKNICLLSSLY